MCVCVSASGRPRLATIGRTYNAPEDTDADTEPKTSPPATDPSVEKASDDGSGTRSDKPCAAAPDDDASCATVKVTSNESPDCSGAAVAAGESAAVTLSLGSSTLADTAATPTPVAVVVVAVPKP